MVDTRPRNARCSDVVKNLSAERKTVGAMDILEWAGRESGIDEDMLASADLGTAQKILPIARFWISNPGETIPRIEE